MDYWKINIFFFYQMYFSIGGSFFNCKIALNYQVKEGTFLSFYINLELEISIFYYI